MPLWRDANRLLVMVEEAVSQFPRNHRYTLGTDLRRQALAVCRVLLRASHEGEAGRVAQLRRLVHNVDDLKLLIQLGKELRVFRSFAQFQALAELAVAVGRQSGGWLKKVSRGSRPETGSSTERSR